MCGNEEEHASWKSTTCNKCLSKGIKICSTCGEILPISNFQLCRGKPIGRCSKCENRCSYEGKKQSGYLNRIDVIAKRNEESRLNKQKVMEDPERRQAIYNRHNERLRERYATDAEYKEKRIASNRAYKELLEGDLTAADWQESLDYFDNQCAYCGSPDRVGREHVIAVSSGGINTKRNVIPGCVSCNSSKTNKDMISWYSVQKFFSNERLTKILEWIGGEPNVPKRN